MKTQEIQAEATLTPVLNQRHRHHSPASDNLLVEIGRAHV